MSKFSQKSLDRLEGVDDRLRALAFKAVQVQDLTVLEGVRSMEKQKQLFRDGKSKTLDSKHLSGKAIDIAPYPIDWQDRERFYHLAGIIKGIAYELGIKIRWGGDWDSDNDFKDQTFDDLVHFEVI